MVGSQNSAQNIEKIAHYNRLPLYSTRSQNGFCKIDRKFACDIIFQK